MKSYLGIIPIIIVLQFCTSIQNNTPENTSQKDSIIVVNVNAALGIPVDQDSTDDFLIYRPQYVLSYNHNRNSPNWVSWNLNKDWYGEVQRYSGNFISDTTLPSLFYKVKHSDYTNSGYDRGHLVRSEERTKTDDDNKSTFILSNVIPQTPDLNRGVWLNLEYYCEELCKTDNRELFVIAGGIYKSGNKLKDKVEVPDSCFKIIVILNRGESYSNISDTTKTIVVVMPNIKGIRQDKWEKYKTTIRRVENSTGYNFLSNVKREIQDLIENN